MSERSVDLLYLACNRLEFTMETFGALLANTDWELVHELFIIDDGSTDGTREWLGRNRRHVPAPVRLLHTNFGSPVSAMNLYIRKASAPMLAKTDNDAMLPPGWLRQSLAVFEAHPELALLGIEAMYPHSHDTGAVRSYVPADFISGLGLYRRAAFSRSLPQPYDKWFGLEEWQMARGPELVRGWISPALPVFLLDRVPFDPWRSYSDAYVARKWQRSWPKYDPNCTLWQWRWPAGAASQASTGPRFLCAMRVKNEGRFIGEALSIALELCDLAIVFDDHSTDDTVSICESFGRRVTVLPSPFEGLDETRDKNYVLRRIVERNPEWVLWIDGDEILERSGPDQLRKAVVTAPGAAALSLRISYMWDDPSHVRTDGIYGRFTRPSLFRLRNQPLDRLVFRASGCGGNFHCGNIPQGLLGEIRQSPVRLKHFGYMSAEQRQTKYAFYTTIDPGNSAEDNYRHLMGIRGSNYAPGPAHIVPWVE